MANADKIARNMCEIGQRMLLDFTGYETGKVCAGAAMWEIAAEFKNMGLMEQTTEGLQPTALGFEVAKLLPRSPSRDGEK